MDIGKFKASNWRLMAWIVTPPVLIVAVGLSTFAIQQRAEWRLNQNAGLTDVLPVFIQAQRNAKELIEDLGINKEDSIGSEDQLISFLQEAAVRREFTVDAVQVVRREAEGSEKIPVLSATVKGTGEFTAIQLFINEIKSAQHLLSVTSIELEQPKRMKTNDGRFEVGVVFELLLIDEVLKTIGGTK